MKAMDVGRSTSGLAAVLALALLTSAPTAAAPRKRPAGATGSVHGVAPKTTYGRIARKPALRTRVARSRGYEQPMYSDGVGSAVGFHPGPYADDDMGPPGPLPGAWRPYSRSGVRETMAIDLLTRSNGYAYGYPFP